MRFLVTGASGFVGRGLLERLSASGHAGVATGREPPPGLPFGWRAVRRHEVLSGDHDATDVEGIVHLEVRQHVPRPTPADCDDFETVNVQGTREWLDWAARHGVRRFVFASSVKAVGPAAGPHFENDTRAADTPYGRSKARAEREVRAWAAGGPTRTAVILRAAPVYGPGNQANLAAFVRQILAGRPCLVGRGEQRKSIVSRSNLAAAIEFAATRGTPGCEVFNVSDPETPTLAELAAMIADLAGVAKPRRIPELFARCVAPLGDLVGILTGRDFPLTSARLRSIGETSIFPCDRLVAEGFRHPQSTREGLAEMVAWARGR